MSIQVRRDGEIYGIEGGWFAARWHFSFDQYYDPRFQNFGNMRVFNDDRLIPGAIWPMHPHRDVEGLTYVAEGTFRHQDDVGGAPGPLPAGSVQRMTLGRGANHSEQNGSETEPMRFIQIWIKPSQPGLEPGVEQKVFTREDRTNTLLRAISPDGRDGSATVHGNASMLLSSLDAGTTLAHEIPEGGGEYAYVIEGDLSVDGERLATGDVAMVTEQASMRLEAHAPTELIVMEVDLTDPW